MPIVQFPTSTPNFTFWYDDSITQANNYQIDAYYLIQLFLLPNCEDDLAAMSDLFGGIMPDPASLPFQVSLVPGGGGGAHPSCLSTQITCFVSPNTDGPAVLGGLRAEMAEVFMATQNQGVNCAYSNGEALSRATASLFAPKNRWRFKTGDAWLNSTRPDWVTTTNPTDQDLVSIGCGTLFYNYLAYQLNFAWRDIIAAGAPTLKETAWNLGVGTAVGDAFGDFSALLAQYFPTNKTAIIQDDNPFPLDRPDLYLRHTLWDDGTTQTGALNRSPDIIMKNNSVANPQATYSTDISINSDAESDPAVVAGQENYIYIRIWNRGAVDDWARAHAYWSPPATLVSPNLWNFIGVSDLTYVPTGNLVQVSRINWLPANIPGPGHYCLVAIVQFGDLPVPNIGTFISFKDFVDYVYAHNDIAWHNFNVISMADFVLLEEFFVLAFFITGAWDQPYDFVLESIAELPQGSSMALEVPRWLGRGLRPRHSAAQEHEDPHAGPDDRHRVRIPLNAHGRHRLGQIELPAAAKAASHLRVHIPEQHRDRPYEVAIRQLWAGREVGRMTWRFVPSSCEPEARESSKL